MTIGDEIRLALRATLSNDVCSAQSLDEEEDRERVLREVMRQLFSIGLMHANLDNALRDELDEDQVRRAEYEWGDYSHED